MTKKPGNSLRSSRQGGTLRELEAVAPWLQSLCEDCSQGKPCPHHPDGVVELCRMSADAMSSIPEQVSACWTTTAPRWRRRPRSWNREHLS